MLNGDLAQIRPLEINDLENLYEWYNEHDFSYWVSGNWPLVHFLRREDIERKMYEEDENRYAITDQKGNLIGTIGFDQVNIPARSARLYIGIGLKDYWGKGYGLDSLTIFIKYLFNQWNFRRLTAETWQNNLRAIACYRKLGFIIEGKLRESYYIHGEYYDGILLGLLKQDFTAIKDK
jgi:RimJ/RimL family protein N-acetyltransferase